MGHVQGHPAMCACGLQGKFLFSTLFMGSVLLNLGLLCVPMASDMDECFERGLVNDFGA